MLRVQKASDQNQGFEKFVLLTVAFGMHVDNWEIRGGKQHSEAEVHPVFMSNH